MKSIDKYTLEHLKKEIDSNKNEIEKLNQWAIDVGKKIFEVEEVPSIADKCKRDVDDTLRCIKNIIQDFNSLKSEITPRITAATKRIDYAMNELNIKIYEYNKNAEEIFNEALKKHEKFVNDRMEYLKGYFDAIENKIQDS